MESQDQVYGASFPLIEKLQLLAEWAPLLSRLQSVADAPTPHDKAVKLINLLRWAAGKTQSELDDDALKHIEAVLGSPEGEAAFGWVVSLFGDKA